MKSLITEIIDFLAEISEMTTMYVTEIETKPMRVAGDVYATGLRRSGLGIVEVHLKRLQKTNVKAGEYNMDIFQKEPEGEIWIYATFLDSIVLRGIFNDIRTHFNSIKSFEVARLNYRLKTDNNSDYIMKEDIIVYDNKGHMCKEVLKRKKLSDMFKSKFQHFDKDSANKIVTDLEFAEAAME